MIDLVVTLEMTFISKDYNPDVIPKGIHTANDFGLYVIDVFQEPGQEIDTYRSLMGVAVQPRLFPRSHVLKTGLEGMGFGFADDKKDATKPEPKDGKQ